MDAVFDSSLILIEEILAGFSARWMYSCGIGRVVYDVDVFVTELFDDRIDPGTLHSHTGSYRIDTVVVGFDSDFGTFTPECGRSS